jgi:hypothetical protein
MPAKTNPLRRGRPAVPAAQLETFLDRLGETASITAAARTAGLQRSTLYHLRERDPEFAACWDKAAKLGIERLQDEAMRRTFEGVEKPVFHAGQQIASVAHFNDRLLQFLLKAHKPETYDRPHGMPVAAKRPFDLVKRMADAEKRMAVFEAADAAEAKKKKDLEAESDPHD